MRVEQGFLGEGGTGELASWPQADRYQRADPESRETNKDMLVLSRNVNGRVVIDGCIIVTVASLDPFTKSITFWLDCPKQLRIDRASAKDSPPGELFAEDASAGGTIKISGINENTGFRIGPEIFVTLIRMESARNGQHRAKLGFQAPDEVPVHRQEVHDEIQRESRVKRLAANLGL